MPRAFNFPLIRPLFAVVLAAGGLSGCAGKTNQQTPTDLTAAANTGGPWFCQPGVNASDWQCDNDPALVANPVPDRKPQPTQPEPTLPSPSPLQTSVVEPAAAGPSTPGPTPAPPPAVVAAPANTTAPLRYQELAYQPAEPVSVDSLPAQYYTVQLTALSSRVDVVQFLQDANMPPLTTVEVERDGELYNVLLLGFYENFARAEQAATDLPTPLDQYDPWIRRLGTLQAAQLRAEKLRAEQLRAEP